MSRSITLTTVNDVVTRRIAQLQTSIEETEAILAGYRSELDPLLKIAQLTALAVPLAVPLAVEPVAVEARAPVAGDVEDVVLSRRWSRFNLPPRHLRFLDRFGESDRIHRKEITDWYKRALGPWCMPGSLVSIVSEITRSLVKKGILRKIDRGIWSIVR